MPGSLIFLGQTVEATISKMGKKQTFEGIIICSSQRPHWKILIMTGPHQNSYIKLKPSQFSEKTESRHKGFFSQLNNLTEERMDLLRSRNTIFEEDVIAIKAMLDNQIPEVTENAILEIKPEDEMTLPCKT